MTRSTDKGQKKHQRRHRCAVLFMQLASGLSMWAVPGLEHDLFDRVRSTLVKRGCTSGDKFLVVTTSTDAVIYEQHPCRRVARLAMPRPARRVPT